MFDYRPPNRRPSPKFAPSPERQMRPHAGQGDLFKRSRFSNIAILRNESECSLLFSGSNLDHVMQNEMGEDGDGVSPDQDGIVSESGVQMRRPWLDQVRETRRHVSQHNDRVRSHHLPPKGGGGNGRTCH